MLRRRVGFDAVVLGDGSVLAVGDDEGCYPGGANEGAETAEIYEPAANRWVVAPSLNKPRKLPATVVAKDGGAVVIGGLNPDDQPFSSVKIFSAETRTWTDMPLMTVARGEPLAATLSDGRIFVMSRTAYESETSTRTSIEIYDPRAGRWTALPNHDGPSFSDLLPLTDGRLLAIGSAFEISIWLEIFDPATNRWIGVEPPSPQDIQDQDWRPQFAALPNGGILAFGGERQSELGEGVTGLTKRFEPSTKRWRQVDTMPTPRSGTASATLADGRVVVVGGTSGPTVDTRPVALTVTEIFDPTTNAWSKLGNLKEPRQHGQLVTIGDRDVLLVGGDHDFNTASDVPWCPAPLTTTERLTLPAA